MFIINNYAEKNSFVAGILAVSFLLGSCSGGDDSVPVSGSGPDVESPLTSSKCAVGQLVSTPVNFPEAVVPCDNLLSAVKVELGRFLFYDRNMSFNRTQSCADCHQQDKAFTDGLITSVGSEGGLHPRNAMSMTNVVYNATQNWANNQVTELDQQALVVLLGDTPIELGWLSHETEMLSRLQSPDANDYAGNAVTAVPDYASLFAQAFPEETDKITLATVTKALAAFGATMVSGNSEYDKDLRGEPNTMSASAKIGRDLFFGEKLECFHCHGGFNFSDSIRTVGSAFTQASFHNNALYNLDGNGAYPPDNPGIREFTLAATDEGKFRVPTLRNIVLTAPYMHDGSAATLDDVIDHYARGGRLIISGPNAGDGALNPNKSGFIIGFNISAQKRADLLEFFNSLTDWEFICRDDLSDPFGNISKHVMCP